jgi:hypothetical protein
MTLERLNHIRAFLESQRELHLIGTLEHTGTIDPARDEESLSALGKHVRFSFELCDALSKLMQGQDEINPKPITKVTGKNIEMGVDETKDVG